MSDDKSANPIASRVTGYRDLNDEDVALINLCKGKANDIDSFICGLENRPPTPQRAYGTPEGSRPDPGEGSVDPRELALARTHLQDGFMHLVKAIAQPRSF